MDANALVPVRQRDLILSLAEGGFFRVRWSAHVLDEFERTLAKLYPSKGEAWPAKQRHAMECAFDDAMVSGYELLLPIFSGGPDPDDAHVMAAAKQCDAAVIVTSNLRDFPADLLAPFGIEAVAPDDFIADAIDLDQESAVAVIGKMRRRLANPALDASALIAQLRRHHLNQTADLLEPYGDQL